MSPRLGIMSYGWAVTRHNKGVIRALCLATWNLVNSYTSNTLQHFDVLGICISISVHAVDGCVRDCTYRRGLSVACSDVKAIPEPQVAEQQQCSPAFFVYKKELSKEKTFIYMRKPRLLLALLYAWVGLLPLAAQSVKITKEMTLHPFATVLPMYKNEFGSFEKPKMDDTFPFAVIRMQLEGNAQAVKAAKELFTLDMGQMTGVESKCTAYSNQILFLVPARRPYIYIDCGDGCDQVLLSNMQHLKSNRVYDCTVHYIPERNENTTTDTIFVNEGPQFYELQLKVEPADAKVEVVMLNGIKQECSVVDGVAKLKLEEGEYRYTISAKHYYPLEGVLSIPTISTDTVFSLDSKVGWLSVVGDSTDLTDLSVEILRVLEPVNGKKNNKKEIKQNISTYPLPLQDLACDTGKYQLKIEKNKYFDYSKTLTLNKGDNIVLSPKMRPHIMNTVLMAEVGIARNPEWGVGLMFAQIYDGVGWYVKGRSNWNISKRDSIFGKTFDTDKETTSLEWIVNGGMMIDFLMKKEKKDKDNFFGVYFGAGYGSRERYWNDSNLGWIVYGLNTYQGVSTDIGLIGSFRGLTLMTGINTIAFKYIEIEVGIGITF